MTIEKITTHGEPFININDDNIEIGSKCEDCSLTFSSDDLFRGGIYTQHSGPIMPTISIKNKNAAILWISHQLNQLFSFNSCLEHLTKADWVELRAIHLLHKRKLITGIHASKLTHLVLLRSAIRKDFQRDI